MEISNPILHRESKLINDFLIERFPTQALRVYFLLNELEQFPDFYVKYVQQKYNKDNSQKTEYFIKNILNAQSGFYFFCGRKGSGKTTLIYSLYKLLRMFEIKREVYVLNVEPIGDMKVLEPSKTSNPYENLPDGAILFHDETHYNVEPTMSPTSNNYKEMAKAFSTQRHKRQVIIQISQTTMNFNKNLLRYCDGHIFLETSIVQELERPEFLPFIKMSKNVLEKDKFNFVFINDKEILHIIYDRPEDVPEDYSYFFRGGKTD